MKNEIDLTKWPKNESDIDFKEKTIICKICMKGCHYCTIYYLDKNWWKKCKKNNICYHIFEMTSTSPFPNRAHIRHVSGWVYAYTLGISVFDKTRLAYIIKYSMKKEKI